MLIAHQMGAFINKLVNYRLQCGSLSFETGTAPHGTMTLNGDHYSLLGGAFIAFVYDTLELPLIDRTVL